MTDLIVYGFVKMGSNDYDQELLLGPGGKLKMEEPIISSGRLCVPRARERTKSYSILVYLMQNKRFNVISDTNIK